MKNRMTAALALTLFAAACTDLADPIEGDDEDTTAIEQGVYTPWYDLSGAAGTGVVRACKTPTRINWEFGYNTYTTAITSGNGMTSITSDISGQTWGQRYRTRGSATTFNIALGKNGSFKGVGYVISQLPDC